MLWRAKWRQVELAALNICPGLRNGLFCGCLTVAACITASRIDLWFARSAGFLRRGFCHINAWCRVGHGGLFNRLCWLWVSDVTNARLRPFSAWARLWCGDKAGICIGQIIEACHQAGLRISGARFCPVIAAGISPGVWAIVSPAFLPIFRTGLIPRLLTIFGPIVGAVFRAIFRALVAAIFAAIILTGLFRTARVIARRVIARLIVAVIAVVVLTITIVAVLLIAVLAIRLATIVTIWLVAILAVLVAVLIVLLIVLLGATRLLLGRQFAVRFGQQAGVMFGVLLKVFSRDAVI